MEEQNGLTIGQPVLRSMIAQTLFAVSDNESRPIHTGSLFEVEKNGLTVVSVDGYRLALRREAVDKIDGAESFSFVALLRPQRGGKNLLRRGASDHQPGARHILFQGGGDPAGTAAGWRGSSWPIRMPSPGTTPSRSRGMPAPCSSPSSASP